MGRTGKMTRMKSDRMLITFAGIFLAIACSPNDPATGVDDAKDSGKPGSDAIAPLDGDERDRRGDEISNDASDGDDASHNVVVLPAQFVDIDTPLRMLGEGDPIELWPAPQGGHVVLVAVKLKNFVGDMAIVRVKARYPGTPFIVAEEARSVKLVPVPDEPDTLQPDLTTRTQVDHVPLCPDYDTIDIVDRPLEFAVQVTGFGSDDPQSGEATLNLYPSCVAGKVDVPFCRCECSANYKLGKCVRDAGSAE